MRFLAAIFVLLTLAAAPGTARAGGTASVTVMPFAALENGGEGWMGKALSDLVAQKLGTTPGFDVLERDKLQEFLKEMELQRSGFADAEAIKRLGGLAQVDDVIYGNYSVEGSTLKLHLLEMDMKTQKIVQQAEAEGRTDDLASAADRLVLDFLQKQGTTLSDEEVKKISFHATDSTPALQHFYKGMDDYDNGKYEEAYGEFTAAARQDDRYLEALLWSARMLEYTGMTDQAVLAYTQLHDAAPQSTEGRDALFFAAKLSEVTAPDKAIAAYRELAAIVPKIPLSLEADMRLSYLYEVQRKPAEAYRALQEINDFREDIDKRKTAFALEQAHKEKFAMIDSILEFVGIVRHNAKDLSSDNENLRGALADFTAHRSRFFNWHDALDLYRGATMRQIALYRDAVAADPVLKPPRGTFYVDPAHATVGDEHFGDTKSLFFGDTKRYDAWREEFYAAVVPKGYTAEGVTLHITGYVPKPTATTDFTLRVFAFPLMKNFYNNWLGTVYGQTASVSALQKEIAFHGRDHDILVFQLIENAGKIKSWSADFRLRKTETQAVPRMAKAEGFFEGQEVARLPLHEEATGVSDPQYLEQYASKKRLALIDLGSRGQLLVVARGDLPTGKTDLWFSRNPDGKSWQPLAPMPVNSISQDFAPKLVRAEDGSARLFWISNRRGLGWEIWTSGLQKDNSWSEPARIPLEKFIADANPGRAQDVTDLLDFDAAQDKHGRWVLAVCTPGGTGIHVISSDDAEKWMNLGTVREGQRFFDPVLMQDGTATWWLGAIDGEADLQLMKSFDLKAWTAHEYALGSYSHHWSRRGNENYASVDQIAAFPMTLFDAGEGRLTLLFSDTLTGLQYATFNPEVYPPQPDLVREISLEPYAVAQTQDAYLAAAWQGDDIVLKKYRHFSFPTNAQNSGTDTLYHETETDPDGNSWDRRTARERYVMSDVTAVGVATDGRAWWGIETGAMALKDRDFFVSDVSMGFFDHHPTDIVPCGKFIWFADKLRDTPDLGLMVEDRLENATDKMTLEAGGHVTATACGGGLFYVGTSDGMVTTLDGKSVVSAVHLPSSYATALAADGKGIWAGTKDGKLFRIANDKPVAEEFQNKEAFPVTSIALGGGALWVATDGDGLYMKKGGVWQQAAGFPYASPAKIKADGQGIWFMPGPYESSRGLGYFDGRTASLYDPPSHNIFDLIDFDIAPDGSVWAGSESSGIYRFERKK